MTVRENRHHTKKNLGRYSTQIVKYLKGISGLILLQEFPELRKSLWRGQLWNGSYFCESIGSTSEENILRYIERQKTCQI